ncbi:MAG: hypothetical protein HRF43_06280 [Phycisphaerae bacterium]|jgi:hypothetical protein
MSEGLGRYLSGKVVGGLVAVCGLLIVIWYWRLTPDERAALWGTARGILIWTGCVAVLPWATFFVPVRVVRAESNLISALMLAGYLFADIGLALFLAGWSAPHAWQKMGLLLGFLCAAVYNFVVCEFVARKAEDAS